MKMNLRRKAILLSATMLSAVAIGCGGAGTTNNDQGIAVTFLGYFSALGAGCTALPAGVAGVVLPLGQATGEPVGSGTGGTVVDGG